MEFEGSDEDIRLKFHKYVASFLAIMQESESKIHDMDPDGMSIQIEQGKY